MDINYEDVFPTSEKEVGQMDVAVEEEELIRESVRRIILEASDFQCNSHSLGFVDDKGNWLDTEGADHSDYLWANVYDMEDRRPGGYPIPLNWIKVSNSTNIFFCGDSFDDITAAQVSGLIKMWGECSKYSRWIQNQPETYECTFATIDPNEGWSKITDGFAMTIPKFLEKYGDRNAVDTFYGMLLGEL